MVASMISTTSFSGDRRDPVYGLDLVRFVAAMLVVAYHLGFKAWALEGSSLRHVLGAAIAYPPGHGLTWCGWIGVQVFFVVSGAVIACSVRGADAGGFARRRIARLLPAVLIAIGIAVPIAILLFGVPPADAAKLAVRTGAFFPWGPWIIGQFWTIPIELSFYGAVWMLLAAKVPERGMRLLPWVLGSGSAGYWLLVALDGVEAGGRLSELLLMQHGIYFALGMLGAQLGERRPELRHMALALLCVGAAVVQVRVAAGWEMAQRPEFATRWLWAYALWLALSAVVALSFLHRDVVSRWIGRRGRALRLLGLSTYPLYLLHIHVGGAILVMTRQLGFVPAVSCAVGGSALAALFVATVLEPPLHRLIRGMLDHVRRPTLAVPQRLVG